jgi:hypothetical protein
VVFGQPEAVETPALAMLGEVEGMVERSTCVAAFGNGRQVEYRERNHAFNDTPKDFFALAGSGNRDAAGRRRKD